MKEKPILFSGDMVRAILEGRKTQTRRVIKNKEFQDWVNMKFSDEFIKNPENLWHKLGPYGQPGDRLWVRETWCLSGKPGIALYRADQQCEVAQWKPSIHMPRWASRISLEIVNIRGERLQEITADECIREGILRSDLPTVEERADYDKWQFSQLWDSINLVRGFGWAANPWIWVIEFKPINVKEVI